MTRVGRHSTVWDYTDVPVVNGFATFPDGRRVESSAEVVRVLTLIPGTQKGRLLHYLRTHAGCSSLDIIRDLLIVNTTGRLSDLRAEGHVIRAVRFDGVFRYWIIEAPVQLAVGL